MKATPRITVLLAEDHMIVRECLRKLLEAERDIEVVGEAATGRQAVQMTEKLRPAVVLMDIAMPLLNGLEATRQIRQAVPDTKVIILSAHGDEAYVEQVTALDAAGYLIKQTSAHVLAEAIRAVQKGNTFFSPSIAKQHRENYQKASDRVGLVKKKGDRLTSREAEVLRLVAEGQSNKQVADRLGISNKSIEKHRQRLMEKLDIHNTAGLTRYAIAAGIIECRVLLTIV